MRYTSQETKVFETIFLTNNKDQEKEIEEGRKEMDESVS